MLCKAVDMCETTKVYFYKLAKAGSMEVIDRFYVTSRKLSCSRSS